jgi:hypothetical protein
MADEQKKELRRCSKCKCTIIRDDNFEKNRKGEWLKTCNGCREKRKASSKKYREANREKLCAFQKAYRALNGEKKKACQKAWREANSEKIKILNRKWCEEHPAEVKEYQKAYRQIYRDRGGHKCEHDIEKQSCQLCDPISHLKRIVATRIYHALKAEKDRGSLEYLGCDITTFRKHIADQFKDNMTWDNYGEWEIDHICPVKYKKDGIPPSLEEVAERLHYTNTQPLWKYENMATGNICIG